MSTRKWTGWRWVFAAFVLLAGASLALGAVMTSGQKTAVSRSMQIFNTVGLGNRLAYLDADGSVLGATTVSATALTDTACTVKAGAVTGTFNISGATVTYRSIIASDLSGSSLMNATSVGSTWLKVGTVLTYLNQITGASTVNATAITDGTITVTAGKLTGATSVVSTWLGDGTAKMTTGIVTASTVTDGTASLNGGNLSSVTSATATWANLGSVLLYQDQITSCSTVLATALCDGAATLTGSNLSGVTSLGATWMKVGNVLTYLNQITGAGTVNATAVTDGTATMTGGNVSGVTSLTSTWGSVGSVLLYAGTVSATNLTDGTCTVRAGAVTGSLNISGAAVTYRAIANGDIDASAAIDRSKLAIDSAAVYGVPLHSVRNVDGTVLTATTGTGSFALSCGGWGAGQMVLIGENSLAQTVTDTLMFEFVLPPSYVASDDVVLQVKAKESVAATVSTTLSAQVYESDGNGGVGPNLAAAFSAAGDVTTTWTTFTSVITDAGLVAGDRLVVFVRIVSDNTGEAALSCQPWIGSIAVLLDVKG